MPKTRESISVAMRFHILRRDKFTCQYCGARAPDTALHIEHIIPVVKGGDNEPENLCAACVRCNLGKGAGDRRTDVSRPFTERERDLDQELWLSQRRLQNIALALFASDVWPAEFRLLFAMLATDDGATREHEKFAHMTHIPMPQLMSYMRGLEACGLLWKPKYEAHRGAKFFLKTSSPDGVHRHAFQMKEFGDFRAFPAAGTVYG
jgi:hypothetical protein